MNNSFSFVDRFKDAIKVARVDMAVSKRVFDRDNVFFEGAVFLTVPVVLNCFLAAMSFPSGFGSIFSKFVFWPVVIPFMALAFSFWVLVFFVQKKNDVKIDFRKMFGLLGYCSIVFWITSLFFLLSLLGLDIFGLSGLVWLGGIGLVYFVAYNFLVQRLHLAVNDALIAVVVSVASMFVAQSFLGRILVGGYYHFLY